MKYKLFLFVVFLSCFFWAAYEPLYPHDWLLENYLVFGFLPFILITGRYFRLSNISYTLITLFLCLHMVGSHYTYSEVPFGRTLGDWLGSDRNMYDRLVHFSFGLLLAYPVREVFVRVAKVKGFWGYFFPVDLTFALSSIYELIEWRTALGVPAELGLSFLGSQGDVWDAQKDMGIAGLGAMITMLIVFLIHVKYDKSVWRELIDSLKPGANDAPLGEVELQALIKNSEA